MIKNSRTATTRARALVTGLTVVAFLLAGAVASPVAQADGEDNVIIDLGGYKGADALVCVGDASDACLRPTIASPRPARR